MGMQNSDDERKIMYEHSVMERIKQNHPDYEGATQHMTEDQKIIYEDGLKKKYEELFGNPFAWENDRR